MTSTQTEPSTGSPEAPDRRSSVARALGVLTRADRVQNLILLAVIILIAAFVTSRQPAFLTWNNLSVAVTGTIILLASPAWCSCW